LEVPEGPVITAAAAERMVRGALDRFGADVGIAVTGVAGPDAEEDVPVGTVFIAAACDLAATLTSERP